LRRHRAEGRTMRAAPRRLRSLETVLHEVASVRAAGVQSVGMACVQHAHGRHSAQL
jgi:hypothetical protein